MLYLHCGLPRTSTTSLQSALFAHREDLAAAGVVYPERWISGGSSHHGLIRFLNMALEGKPDFNDLRRFLSDRADQDIVFSVEGMTYWLHAPEWREALIELLAAAADVMPVKCIWTLRRLDELFVSLYLLRLALGLPQPPPDEFFRRGLSGRWVFAGMQAIDTALGGACAYLRYDSGGAHNRELIGFLSLPDGLAEEIRRELDDGRRLNPRLTQKQAVICLNFEQFCARLGTDLDRDALRMAVYRRELKFDQDAPCELLDTGSRRALHERALAAARQQGFQPYVDYYADAEPAAGSPVSLDPGVVTDEDLSRLVECLSVGAHTT